MKVNMDRTRSGSSPHGKKGLVEGKHVPSVKLLEAVMHFTAERNREQLASVLLKTMIEVLPAAAIEFHPCHANDGPGPGSGTRIQRAGYHANGLALPDDVRLRLRADLTKYLQNLRESEKVAQEALVETPEYSLHPLLDAVGVSGVIAIENLSGGADTVDPKMVYAFLRIYSNFAAVIDDSHRDTLTGLLNRRTFEESIQDVLLETRETDNSPPVDIDLRKAAAAGACYWLAVMDIDHFKRINDTFGHLYGDEVLLLLARLMMQSFRRFDRIYRFGGEEFAVLLSPCTLEDARAVLERFRAKTENFLFPQVGKVTISIGFVAIKLQDVPATVVGHADEALYASKHNGRNCVTCYEDLGIKKTTGPVSDVDLF
jgi:diguanylate cyclase (GGDEF)-like protein